MQTVQFSSKHAVPVFILINAMSLNLRGNSPPPPRNTGDVRLLELFSNDRIVYMIVSFIFKSGWVFISLLEYGRLLE